MFWFAGGIQCLIALICLFGFPSKASLLVHYNRQWEKTDYISVGNNGYKGITVAFPPEINVGDANRLINNAKTVFIEASKALHKATEDLASFSEINFLIPRSWSAQSFPSWTIQPAIKETYETATFRIVSTDQEFQSANSSPKPLAVQYAGCGKPGKYILVPKLYFTNLPTDRSVYVRYLVKEWARYRYGVFEERGYPDDPLYPLFYNTPGYENETILLNSCTNAKLAVRQINKAGQACQVSVNETTGLPYEDECYLDPSSSENDHIQSSIMFSPIFPNADSFCGSHPNILHDPSSPNKQNALCHSRSIMEVIKKSTDFQFGSPTQTPATPTFNMYQEADFELALAIEVTTRMSPYMGDILVVLEEFLKKDIPANITAYLGVFGSSEEVKIHKKVIDDNNRLSLLTLITDDYSDQGDACLICVLQSLLISSQRKPLTVMAVTSAKMNEITATDLTNFLSKNEQIKLHLIVYPSGEKINPQLQKIILSNDGNIIQIKNSGKALLLTRLLDAFLSVLGKESPRNEVTTAVIPIEETNKAHSVPFSLNQIEQIESLHICLYQKKEHILILKSKLELALGDIVYDFRNPEFSQPVLGVCQAWCFTFKENIAQNGFLNFTATNITDKIVVKVWIRLKTIAAKNLNSISEQINLRSWYEWVKKEDEYPNALVIYADLRQGSRPIRGAKVQASIMITTDDDTADPTTRSEIQLYDNGAGDPDISKSDGIYSRYFSSFPKSGGYVIEIYVTGESGEVQVLETFPDDDFSQTAPRWKQLDGFRRSLPVATTFQVNWEPSEIGDIYPPNRIVDLTLRVQDTNDRSVVLSWTAPGNNFDDDTLASEYTIKYFMSMDNARDRFDETGVSITKWEIQGEPLKPKGYGQKQDVTIQLKPSDEGGFLFFAMVSSDESNNTSPVSNVVSVYLTKLIDKTTSSPNSTDSTGQESNYKSGGLTKTEIGLLIGCVLIAVILIFVVVILVIYLRRKKKNKQERFPTDRNRTNAFVVPPTLGSADPKPTFETTRNGSSIRVMTDPPDPARLSISSGGPIQSWPAETLLSHYDRVQEAKQKNHPRPILSVGDLLESLSESNSSVASVPVQQNGGFKNGRRENGFSLQRPSSQLSSHSKQVTQV